MSTSVFAWGRSPISVTAATELPGSKREGLSVRA